ncbi:MAG: uroporphyrinogen decarboxylase family protein [Burkholderiaceae bacterium]
MNDTTTSVAAAPSPAVTAPTAARAAHDARWQRIVDSVALKRPDRMPVAMYATFWLATYGGVSYKDVFYDYELTARLAEQAVREFEPDAVAPLFTGTALGRIFEAVDFKQVQWPGHGVGDHQPYQYLDREYVSADELRELLADPTGFYLNTYFPRVFGAFKGMEKFPRFPGMFYIRGITGLRPLVDPDVRQALRRMLDAADEVDRFMTRGAQWNRRIAELGFPLFNGSNSGAPYDVVADYFRGATGMMKDLFRHKELLHEVLDMMRRNLVRVTVGNARASGNPIVFIPIHWAPDAFMSPKQFETFWWPSFRQMMLDLIDEGLVPMPLWEADCTKRLEVIKDIPAGKCIYWFERTDIVKAFEVLGDRVALRGNLSPSMMTTGTPADVEAAVKHLVERVWNEGGHLILDTAFGIPDETPVANVRAMFDAARRFAR